MQAKVHSFFAGGTVDGPGIRFVIFLKGCPLRCLYCHNPDTWSSDGASLYDTDEIVQMALKYKGYYRNGGGVTVTGGEPLLQIDFVIELFKKLKEKNIHTAIDTSGILFEDNDKYHELIKYTDLVLLDIKHINDEEHKKLTRVSNKKILEFARFLSDNNIKMWIRHVLLPEITLNDQYLLELRDFINTLKTVEKVEVLPYHTMGVSKYESLGIDYPLKDLRTPTKEEVNHAKSILLNK
ncbi:MAG: pyruvate formate-lyase-activating protein [Anaeroplasma sp.]